MSPKGTLRTDEQIIKALHMVKDADSVELKLTVPDNDQRSAIGALDLDVLDAELRQVIFFDTADLKLDRNGLVVRARRIRKGGDTVIKLRPIVPDELPQKLRRSGAFNIEVDAMPGNLICSGSLKGKVDNAEVKQVLSGKRTIRKLFTNDQRALYKDHAPKNLDLNSLVPLGPINVARLKCSPKNFKGLLVGEMWFYPDGTRILELSTKCTPDEAFRVLVETRAYLSHLKIELTGEQQTKTRRALEYFSRLRRAKRP